MANGKSDIKLTDDFGGQVKVEAPDFCVDGGPERRSGSQTPYRRALVHAEDGLTINWDNDYTGGVTINGLKEINARSKRIMTSPDAIHLTISGNTKVSGDVTMQGKVQVKKKTAGVFFLIPGSEENPYYWDLDDALSQLSERVTALEKKSMQ